MATRTLIGLVVLFLLGAASPAAADFWAITRAPVTINGEQVPAGKYIPIAADGINFWYSSIYKDADRIPKSDVLIVPRYVPKDSKAHGQINTICKLYYTEPDTFRPLDYPLDDDLIAPPPNYITDVFVLWSEANTTVVQFHGQEDTQEAYLKKRRRIATDCLRLAKKSYSDILPIGPPYMSENSLIDKPLSMRGTAGYISQFVTIALFGGGLLGAVYLAGAVAYRSSRA